MRYTGSDARGQLPGEINLAMTVSTGNPVISVVLPVYNCAQYVGEAVQSILDQTFTDFELIIIDDGSTDQTPDVLREYRDPRIRRITQSNQGLAATLNRGIGLARGGYIARQDADDISLPERFHKQILYLESHPTCALVGTWAEIWQERERTERRHRHPCESSTLKFELLFNNPFVHSSVVLRKTALDRVGGYAPDGFPQTGDYELWSRIAHEYDVGNVPEIFQIYREVGGSLSRVSVPPVADQLVMLSAANIAWAAGTDPTNPHVINLAALVHSAQHRLVGRPNFNAMRKLLGQAVERITDESERPRMKRAAAHRITGLQLRYWAGVLLGR